MATKCKKLEEKVRKYRVVFHNITVEDKDVKEVIKKELGENVEIDKWEIERYLNYEAKTDPHCLYPLPQRETFVMVGYREYLPQ